MIGVCENDLRAEFFERFIAESFDGGLRANRHEERSFDRAVGSGHTAAAGIGIGFENFEGKAHDRSLTGLGGTRLGCA